jgi:hypothetical protein
MVQCVGQYQPGKYTRVMLIKPQRVSHQNGSEAPVFWTGVTPPWPPIRRLLAAPLCRERSTVVLDVCGGQRIMTLDTPEQRRIAVAPNQTVVTIKAIDRWPFHGIPAGERGTVLDIDEETGSVLVAA